MSVIPDGWLRGGDPRRGFEEAKNSQVNDFMYNAFSIHHSPGVTPPTLDFGAILFLK